MQWRQNLLLVGFILILLGTLLLIYFGMQSGGSTFFLIPFFFFGVGSTGVLVSLLFLLVFIIAIAFMMNIAAKHSGAYEEMQEQEGYMPIGAICRYCGRPIPANSSFCSFCGKPIE
jgi:hypothetical protein